MSGTRDRSIRYGERAQLTKREAFGPRDRTSPTPEHGRWRRVTPPNDHDGMDITEVLVAEFSNPDLYRLAALIPEKSALTPGCPRDYPNWALLAYGHLASAYRSHRGVHTALRVKANWDIVLRTVAETAGPDAVASLRPKALLRGPSRNHWNYWFKQHKHLWQMLDDAYTPMAVAQAVEQGLLDPEAARSYFAPGQRNIVYGDGKVMNSPVRHRPRRDKQKQGAPLRDLPPRRTDPASAFWPEGGDDGQDAHGTKFVFTSVRGPGHMNRVCLAMDLQRKTGPSEADIAVHQIARVVGLAGKGVHAAAWDGALSHLHIDPLMARLGLVVISPTKAKSNPDGVRSGQVSPTRIEKEAHVQTVRHRTSNGPCEHPLYARGGRMGQALIDSNGKQSWHLLPIIDLERRQDKNGYRWYHVVTIPCGTNGDHTMRVPLVQSDDDSSKGFLRSEYLRQLPHDTKGYERTYGTRPAAESDNSQREERFTWRRLPAYGSDGQSMVMLGMNFLDNSKSLYLHRRRAAAERPDDQAAA